MPLPENVIQYDFQFPDGTRWQHSVALREQPFPLEALLPDWTQLEFHRCEGCEYQGARCPVAVRLIEPFSIMDGALVSHREVEVTVHTQNRTYVKKTDVQEGLSSLFGLIMATSGCPSMDFFRPLASTHLPFSTYDDTLFRVLSAYFLRHHLDKTNGSGDVIGDLSAIYAQVGGVNRGIIGRLRAAALNKGDAASNALIILDAFAMIIPASLEEKLDELKVLFASTKN